MDNGDPHVREVVRPIYEELLQSRPVLPGDAKYEPAAAVIAKEMVDEPVESANASIREPLTRLGQRAARQLTGLRKASCQTRMLTTEKSARIAIKAKGRILFIDAADLVAVEAKGNYVLLLHPSGPHMLRESISTIEEKLNLHGFVRIHRSVLVNAALVEEIHSCSTGDYVLSMRGGREFTVTRTYKKNLQLLAQLWIGLEGFATD